MKRALSAFLLAAATSFAADDVVMRSMRDEVARSMKKLQLESLQKPYFIAYRMVETSGCSAIATFGALNNSNCDSAAESRFRNLSVEVRVGDYARDNTNFFVPMTSAGVARPLVLLGHKRNILLYNCFRGNTPLRARPARKAFRGIYGGPGNSRGT